VKLQKYFKFITFSSKLEVLIFLLFLSPNLENSLTSPQQSSASIDGLLGTVFSLFRYHDKNVHRARR